jgi:hypothetical protein
MASRKGAARGAVSSRSREAPKKQAKQSGGRGAVTKKGARAPIADVPEAETVVTHANDEESTPADAATDAVAPLDDALPLDMALDTGDDEEPALASESPEPSPESAAFESEAPQSEAPESEAARAKRPRAKRPRAKRRRAKRRRAKRRRAKPTRKATKSRPFHLTALSPTNASRTPPVSSRD